MENRLEMRHITKRFPGVVALDDFSFSLRPGEVHALVGENGAGKSTLMKILYGVFRQDEGEIYVDGVRAEINHVRDASRLGIGVVFQELNVCPHLSIADNIFLGRIKRHLGVLDDRWAIEKAGDILHNMVDLDLDPRTLVGTLSIAQQQMVEIARVVSKESSIIVFDEPTSSLTEKEIDHLFAIIDRLKKQGVGIIYISHRMEELDRIADRVTVMRDGKHIETAPYKDLTKEELVRLMVDREMTKQFPQHARKIGDEVFCARNIISGSKLHIDEISVKSGEIVGLSGLVGAGRTEAMKVLFGCYPGKVGTLLLEGKETRPFTSTSEAISAGLVYMTEDRKKDGLSLGLSVEENINMASFENIASHGVIREREADENAKRMIIRLGIKTTGLEQKAQLLSGGNQQKVILAKWLLRRMRVLIFDEPTRGIDVGAKYDIYQIMNELSDAGIGIIMISSELPEIVGMSDRVYVFREGQVSAELTGKEINAQTIMEFAAGVSKKE